jgi:hypothetical protein
MKLIGNRNYAAPQIAMRSGDKKQKNMRSIKNNLSAAFPIRPKTSIFKVTLITRKTARFKAEKLEISGK